MMEYSASEFLAECDGLETFGRTMKATGVAGFNPLAFLGLVKQLRELATTIAALIAMAQSPEVAAILAQLKTTALALLAEIKALFGVQPTPTPTPDNGVV